MNIGCFVVSNVVVRILFVFSKFVCEVCEFWLELDSIFSEFYLFDGVF